MKNSYIGDMIFGSICVGLIILAIALSLRYAADYDKAQAKVVGIIVAKGEKPAHCYRWTRPDSVRMWAQDDGDWFVVVQPTDMGRPVLRYLTETQFNSLELGDTVSVKIGEEKDYSTVWFDI